VFERFSHPQRVGDKIVGRVWSFHDITAAKQAEDRRRRAEEQLRQSQKLEAIGRLAAGVAHDFNNILTAIIGNAYLLEPAVSDDGLAQEYLQQIITNAERASKLIKQLMIFSRTHALNCEPLDFNEVLCGMIEMLRRLIGENIDLRVNCTPGPQTVMADRSAMEQLILNLVINARDAMPHGGILTLSASAVELDQSAATQRGLTKPGRYLCFSVEDTGVGMDKAVQERIFDPFFTTKETGKGTGLGLSTVHGIVQQHGGAIEVESAPGRGSKFTVFFPTLPGKAPARNESVQNIATRGQGELVMVVEDDPAVRRMVETALGKLGYSVISATSGLEAIELWPKYRDKVRVLMTDIVMPGGIDGVEVAARFRKDNPSLGIVLTSGYSSELAEGCAALPEGCKFLAKPYQMAHLADVIQASLK
ncbi:MAG: ATP-binding protein, partial [Verrucomicrobiae bacterium]|nr:ATP-binding protein [Verrucomicrobiae bacterium]